MSDNKAGDASDQSEEVKQIFYNKADIATVFSVSKPTIELWVKKGFPFVSQGTNGKEWKFDLAPCLKWKEDLDAEEKAEAEEKERRIGQARLDLLGDTFEDAGVSLDPKQYKDLLNLAKERAAAELQMGMLVRVSVIEATLKSTLISLSEQLQALPDYLEKRCALSPDVIAQVQDQVDKYQADMVHKLRELEFLNGSEISG